MKNIDFGQTVNTLANIGVIAGIVFLIMELQQNNELQQLQYEAEERVRVRSAVELVVNNPDYSELLSRDERELSQAEKTRLLALGIAMLLNFENLYEDMVAGRVTEAEAVRRISGVWWRDTLNYGVPFAWETFKVRSDPDFIQWMDENVVNKR